MKSLKYVFVFFLLLKQLEIYAQQTDTTVSIKVSGACEQCKDRIEKAARLKGVTKADWNVDTKMLFLEFNPAVISISKIKNRIVSAGHDIEGQRADDKVYNKLPGCCHYREMEEATTDTVSLPQQKSDTASVIINNQANTDSSVVRGVVIEENKTGEFKPLAGANIQWLKNKSGVVTDKDGVFKISGVGDRELLVISYAGYKPDTILVADKKELKIILASNKTLAEVTVTSRNRSSYVSVLNPVRTQIITEKELFKAACCNLSESFETNPSVDVTYNDAVTGAKQIQLLGLSGSYTQLTVENLPGPRGIATPWGLNSIAGPWVESIQLTKGIGSVINGFESIAGQINVELKKPESKEKLYANAYVNDFGKTDFNLNLAKHVGKKWSTALLLHDDFLTNKKLDFNKDGFRDQPTGNQFGFINRWDYEGDNGLCFFSGIKFLDDNKTGGQTGFDPATDKFTENSYGLGIKTSRKEFFTKIGYVFPAKKYKSIGLQISLSDHDQNSYFGLNKYDATQNSVYSNLIYQSIIGTTAHKFKTGMSFVSDRYNEAFNSSLYKRTETVPGAFFEYTYNYKTRFNLVAGLRADKNNLSGWFVTPRLHLRYEPATGTTIRLSAGRGQRTANIFSENMAVFVSARKVNIAAAANGYAYGLNPEVAWNEGVSFDQKFRLFHHNANIGVDFFRTDFTKQVVVDLENAGFVNFYDLKGRSYSNSLQVELDAEPLHNLEVKLAYRFFDVKTTYSDKLLKRPLVASHRSFMNLAYTLKKFKFDYTVSYNGSKRIPDTKGFAPEYQMPEYSPSYFLMNAQISKTVGKKHPVDLYMGSENLLNYFQKKVILSAENPFGPDFDASMIWGPVSGRMFYAGFRFKLI